MGDTAAPPHVYTIAADQDFLGVLADAVLAGFPAGTPPDDLARTTILVPNRRSAQRLQQVLHQRAAAGVLLLPHIRPIGDIDEDMAALHQAGDLPEAISPTARLFLVMRLVHQWADQNPGFAIARDLAAGGGQLLALAQSLTELADQAEEDGADLKRLDEFYDADIAGHRQAILALLDIIRVALPAELHRLGLMDPRQRRNALIRLEAERLSRSPPAAPVIAAGSTGTFASTRALLRAIAHLPRGAVILPGLDRTLDDRDWAAVTPQHPQYALKNLIAFLGLGRSEVALLGPAPGPRALLASEIMRPSETSEQWRAAVAAKHEAMAAARKGLSLLRARDRHLEARSIALVLRRTLEQPGRTAALVTPDRDLARRVKEEVKRWGITLDDTAGEPLIRFGAAQLISLLIQAAADGFTAASVLALVHHPLTDLGLGREPLLVNVRRLEMVVFRPVGADHGLAGLRLAVSRARDLAAAGELRGDQVARLTSADWEDLALFWHRLEEVLAPLATAGVEGFSHHLALVRAALAALAPGLDWTTPDHLELAELLDEMEAAAAHFPVGPLARAASAMAQRLASATHRPRPGQVHPRLSVMGLLEARLMRPDVAVLGGLNEGKWPAQPDGGPWLNRPMRGNVGLEQPERAIGQTAHDLVQAMGAAEVHLTWSERLGNEPVGPSRWLLRLDAVMAAAGLPGEDLMDCATPRLAAALDHSAGAMRPVSRPAPRPAVALRPRRFSVTDIEKLIRDPYVIFARKVLRLEPLEPLGKPVDAALRGSLFHQIIARFNQTFPQALPADPEGELLSLGEEAFRPHAHDPEVRHFWWPRFRRLAHWLATAEATLRPGTAEVFAERSGGISFEAAGETHELHARADRLDLLADGRFRIIDYKTGSPPSTGQVESGLAPQLTLEAALLARGGFAPLQGNTAQILYIQAGGGHPPGDMADPLKKGTLPVDDLATRHFAALVALLSAYGLPATPYLPRHRLFHEEDVSDFDHLSRYAEWRLADGTSGGGS